MPAFEAEAACRATAIEPWKLLYDPARFPDWWVDMARVEIQYGKDPEMLKLAHGIIAAQEKEIAQMQAWRKKHPTP